MTEPNPGVPVVDIVPPEPPATIDVTVPPASPAPPAPSAAPPPEWEKLHKRTEYLARQFERGLKQLQDTVQGLTNPDTATEATPTATMTTAPLSPDPLDQLAERDWKAAVRQLGQEEAKRVYQQMLQADQERLLAQQRTQQLERSKQRVREQYPHIDDETHEETKAYIAAMNTLMQEDPSILQNPYGPELAMYRMEKTRATPPTPPQAIEAEVSRRLRATSAALPPGRAASPTRIVLTEEEQQYCDARGIPYDRYAALRDHPERLREGVSVP